jgi:hypothetical protein
VYEMGSKIHDAPRPLSDLPGVSSDPGLRISLDDVSLAKLPRLKLVRDGVFGGEVAPSKLCCGLLGAEGRSGFFAFSASDSRNSTNRLENDSSPLVLLDLPLLSRFTIAPFGDPFGVGPFEVLAELPRCKPALSRSSTDQLSTLPISDSISNRLLSLRGALRNCKMRLVINRPSTLESDVLLRNLRSASVRCSFKMTAEGIPSQLKSTFAMHTILD